MKAAVLETIGSPLVVRDVAEPVLGTGEVVVDVSAAEVLTYAGDVFSGIRGFLLTPPVIPGAGAVGRVRAMGPDAARLAVGDWVFCDPTVRSRDDATATTIVLQGLTAGDERGLRLQKYVHDGSWAECVRVPTESAVPIGVIDAENAGEWSTIGRYLVPYGGLLAADLRAGETVVVNGATGGIWKRGRGGRAGDGRRVRRRNGPQPRGPRRSRAPLRTPRAYGAGCRERGRRSTANSRDRARPH
jgi:alcohol dehydrogenase